MVDSGELTTVDRQRAL